MVEIFILLRELVFMKYLEVGDCFFMFGMSPMTSAKSDALKVPSHRCV